MRIQAATASIRAIFTLAALASWASCAPAGSGSDTAEHTLDLRYTANPANYTIGTPITPNAPIASVAFDSFSITPALPSGLSFDASTGIITGEVDTITPAATYRITGVVSGETRFTDLTIAINDHPPTISYAGLATQTFQVGHSITAINPVLGGGANLGCTSSPDLPSGLTLASNCQITGTPLVPSAAANYVVSAYNSGGSGTLTFTFTVIDNPPVITYSGSPYTKYRGVEISAITPTSTGGTVTSCSSSPTLPTGLALGSDCSISGTPTALSSQTTYSITATNSGGSASAPVKIAVVDELPVISYSGTPYTFVKGTAISSKSVTNTGGAIDSCSSSPALPSGLSLSSGCQLTGTPTVVASLATYTISATNTAGTATASLSLKVNDIPPTLSYTGSPYTFVYPNTITPVTPTTGGGAITGCTSTPTLPPNLSLSGTCVISGTPTAAAAAANYAITATNTGGAATATINIQINTQAPTLAYTGSPYTFQKNITIPVQTPTTTGAPITSCSSSPVLPVGLSLSSSCVISGTPSAMGPATNYTITGTNAGGSASATISITIKDTPPDLSYAGSPYTFYYNTTISTVTPTNAGGAVVSCSSSPTLPTGLALSNGCVITGKPTALSSATNYTITATNTGGSTTSAISIEVDDIAPAIAYAGSPFTFNKNVAIPTVTPTNTGGTIASCTASPSLPTNLAINNTTCVITGTPNATSATAGYVITAANATGSSSVSISITVNDTPPTLVYSPTTYVFTKGTLISTITPTTGGGPITSCTSSPSLPTGLSISNTTCVITGTPSTVAADATYTITASNTGGSASVNLDLTVNDVAPTLSYSPATYTYTNGTTISAVTPTTGGGAITSCSSSPSLPSGLSLSNTCVISGTPSAVATTAAYTITASNSGGTASAALTFTVKDVAPTLSYAGSPFTYTVGTAISTLTPTTGGGAITSCSSSPSLPAGLSLSSTCVLSGTPTTPVAAANYAITGTNSGGSANATINITVKDVAPSLSYTGSPFVLTMGSSWSLSPNNSGGAITSCSPSPALPAGLTLASDCSISGTPSAITSAANYTITGTNSGGSSNATIRITVNDVVPGIAYTPASNVFVVRDTISAWSASNSGGAITSCSSSPSLPSGLAISNTTCAITGTPDTITSSASYTITATNTGGSSAATLIIQVKDQPYVIFSSIMGSGTDPSTSTWNDGPSQSKNIWKVTRDGVTLAHLTANWNTPGLDSVLPAFFSDGSEIVFSSLMQISGFTPGSSNIWTATGTGGGATNRTTNFTSGRDSSIVDFSTGSPAGGIQDAPQFSPDGTKIAFASLMKIGTHTSTSYNIWIMSSDGTGLTSLTGNYNGNLDSYNPVFSSDGQYVYFSSTMNAAVASGTWNGTANLSSNIWKVAVSGISYPVQLTTDNTTGINSYGPTVDPGDGSIVYFSTEPIVGTGANNSYNIWSMSSTGASQTALTTATLSGFDSKYPSVSPDGTEIAFSSLMKVSGTTSGSYNVWKMSANGSSQVALTQVTASSQNSYYPVFSPDNSKIAFFSKLKISGTAAQSYNIWVMNQDGTSQTPLTKNTGSGFDSYLPPGQAWYAP